MAKNPTTPAAEPEMTPVEADQTVEPTTEPTQDTPTNSLETVVEDVLEATDPEGEDEGEPKEDAPADPVIIPESLAAKALREKREAMAAQLAELEAELAAQEEADFIAATEDTYQAWLPDHEVIAKELEEARELVAELEIEFEASLRKNPRFRETDVSTGNSLAAKSKGGKRSRNLNTPTWSWRYKLNAAQAAYLDTIKDPEEKGGIVVKGLEGAKWAYFDTKASDERHGRFNAQDLLRDVLGSGTLHSYVATTKETLVKTQ